MAVSCDRVVHALRRRGVWIDLVHLRTRAEPSVALRENGRDRVVPVRPDAPHALASFFSAIEKNFSHVVAFGGTLPFVAAPAYAAWLGVPLVTLLRGNDFDTGVFWPERRPALEDAIRRAARVGCVTEDQRRRVQRLFPEAAAAWTPNGIDLETWRALPSDRRRAAAWRDANGQGRKRLGLFGELKAKKGVETLLEAIARADAASKLHLVVAGTLPPDFPLPAGLTASVLPSMPRTDLIPYMLACDAVALPSLYEGFPNVLLEAAALGVPFVASEAGGAGVLRDGVHGVLFRPGDVQDCALALQKFISFGTEAWRPACIALADEFSVDAECERYLELFAETTARRASVALLSGAGAAS
jgi:glycosyltransferase involved in cell wall biosynthesis